MLIGGNMLARYRTFACAAVMVAGYLAVIKCEARADTRDIVNALLTICAGGGSEEKLDAQGQVDVALTLKKLRTGDIGGSGGIATKYSKSEWQGLIGGINAQVTEMQAAQADKVRDCLKPYMPGIVDAILKTTR
jgi:hypothetical protein